MSESKCNINGCSKKVKVRGMCTMHAAREDRNGSPYIVKSIHGDDVTRFWSKVNRAGADECWMWTGNVHTVGYGKFSAKGKTVYAHRYAVYLTQGIVLTSDQFVMHSCDVQLCVNPEHLSIGTPKDNTHDMIRKGRAWFQKESS